MLNLWALYEPYDVLFTVSILPEQKNDPIIKLNPQFRQEGMSIPVTIGSAGLLKKSGELSGVPNAVGNNQRFK